MKITISLLVGGLLFALYLIGSSQNPAQAVGLNRFEQAANMLEASNR